MVLGAIILATLAAGLGSVWVAALLMRLGGRHRSDAMPQRLLSLAAGALLATAFMHLLPEAFEGGEEPHKLFATLLIGVVFFFLLDKAELWHHGHEHGHHEPAHGAHAHHPHGHDHGHHHAHGHGGSGGWSVLAGDSVHCFGDGILIASAFLADPWLGAVAALSVLAHEVPHHMGDLVVLGQGRGTALLKLSLAGTVTALGGVLGYFLVQSLEGVLPYFLVVASSSFIYVALADLIPQLQRRLTMRQTVQQVLSLLLGMAVVMLVSGMVHHGHAH
ncbi:ZIP family metal transporter [Comamonas humi]